jgi:hypothetical protein
VSDPPIEANHSSAATRNLPKIAAERTNLHSCHFGRASRLSRSIAYTTLDFERRARIAALHDFDMDPTVCDPSNFRRPHSFSGRLEPNRARNRRPRKAKFLFAFCSTRDTPGVGRVQRVIQSVEHKNQSFARLQGRSSMRAPTTRTPPRRATHVRGLKIFWMPREPIQIDGGERFTTADYVGYSTQPQESDREAKLRQCPVESPARAPIRELLD